MNDIQITEHVFHAVDAARDQFEAIVENNPSVDWASESMFAYQMISANSHVLNIAKNNRESVKNAVINVAAVGLSLNPATKYAYLVPRGGAICLDISYQGLIKIATDSGSIKWAKAELVYEGDEFIYKGPAEMPEHNISNPFASGRGKTIDKLQGCYCVAKTNDGDFLVEIMTAEEIYKIRDEASAAGNKGPWGAYPGEMTKKCVIKRASKTWPKTNQHERLAHAVDYLNETEGSDFGEVKHRFKPGEKAEIIERMREYLVAGDSFGVMEICEDYNALAGVQPDSLEYQEQIKFWSLFGGVERDCIHKLLDDSLVERDRVAMGKPELNEPIEVEA